VPSSIKHVAVATDDAFALPTAVTLRSLLTTAQPDEFSVLILHGGIKEGTKAQIADSLPESGSSLTWLQVDDAPLRALPTHHLSVAAYYRLMIPELLPDAERVLYLDSDVLIRKSLAPLWQIDLGGHLIGAVRSVNYPSLCTWGAMDHWREIGLSPRAAYFNSGVMMIDVDGWLRESIRARVVDFVTSKFANGATVDQQALNAVLSERWLELAPIWNLQSPLLDDRRGGHLLYDDTAIAEARTNPRIVHFSDRPKPWHRDSSHSFCGEWRAVAADTSFAPIELDATSILANARWRVKRAASALIRGR
jgi:lipopolysaccharide biosynthesis glycosyltransferase